MGKTLTQAEEAEELSEVATFESMEIKTPAEIRIALRNACTKGDVNAVQAILIQYPNNVNVNKGLWTWPHESMTPLMLAVHLGHTELVQFLLQQPGINVSAMTNDMTALAFALESNNSFKKANYQIASQLMKAGADINQITSNNSTALISAWVCSNQGIAIKLIRRFGADITINEQLFERYHKGQYTYKHVPQQIELTKKRVAGIKDAQRLGIDIGRRFFLLHQNLDLRVAEWLFKQNSLEMRAFKAGREGIRQLLTSLAPIPRPLTIMRPIKDMDTIMPSLRLACNIGDVTSVRAILIQNSMSVNSRLPMPYSGHDDDTRLDGITPLMIAANLGHTELVKYLLQQPKIDVSLSHAGITALSFALQGFQGFQNANYQIAYQLIQAGADINQVTDNSNLLLCAWKYTDQQTALALVTLFNANIAISAELFEQYHKDEYGYEDVPQQIAITKKLMSENAPIDLGPQVLSFICKDLIPQVPVPRPLTFMRQLAEDLYCQQWAHEYNAKYPDREAHGYGFGAVVPYKQAMENRNPVLAFSDQTTNADYQDVPLRQSTYKPTPYSIIIDDA